MEQAYKEVLEGTCGQSPCLTFGLVVTLLFILALYSHKSSTFSFDLMQTVPVMPPPVGMGVAMLTAETASHCLLRGSVSPV